MLCLTLKQFSLWALSGPAHAFNIVVRFAVVHSIFHLNFNFTCVKYVVHIAYRAVCWCIMYWPSALAFESRTEQYCRLCFAMASYRFYRWNHFSLCETRSTKSILLCCATCRPSSDASALSHTYASTHAHLHTQRAHIFWQALSIVFGLFALPRSAI